MVAKNYQNALVKCHSVNETRSFVDIFPQHLYNIYSSI